MYCIEKLKKMFFSLKQTNYIALIKCIIKLNKKITINELQTTA